MFKNVNAIDPGKLVKKTDDDTKVEEIGKYLTNELNKFSSEIFNKKLKQTELATKNDIADFTKKTYFDDQLKSINLHPTNIFYIQIVTTGVHLDPTQNLTVNLIIKQ